MPTLAETTADRDARLIKAELQRDRAVELLRLLQTTQTWHTGPHDFVTARNEDCLRCRADALLEEVG